jgi:CRISPR/Cas system-associated endonuclease Cas1
MFQEGFHRDKDGGDRINSLLNYGYGILRGHGMRAVIGAGLIPSLGCFHSHRANPFNLVEDLIEPFRPMVDDVVRHLPARASLKKGSAPPLVDKTTSFGHFCTATPPSALQLRTKGAQ